MTIVISTDNPSEKEIGRALEPDGCQISVPSVSYTPQGQQLRYELHWRASPSHMVNTIATRPFLRRIKYVSATTDERLELCVKIHWIELVQIADDDSRDILKAEQSAIPN